MRRGRKRPAAKRIDAPQKPRYLPPGLNYAVAMESSLALAEYREKERVRVEMARNETIQKNIDQRDSYLENWMWSLFGVVLHRRYRLTGAKICEIFEEIQSIHNRLYDESESYEETNRRALEMLYKEVGINLDDLDM